MTYSVLEESRQLFASKYLLYLPNDGTGYVGVGKVIQDRVPVDDFIVDAGNGKKIPIWKLKLAAANLPRASKNPEKAEYFVRVKWIKTVPLSKAIKEKGFFGNQNTVARPRTAKWNYTVERLKKVFGID